HTRHIERPTRRDMACKHAEIRVFPRHLGIVRGGRTTSREANATRSEASRGGHPPPWRANMADKSITKTELVASIASATGQSQAAVSGVLDALFSTVAGAV